MDFFLQMKTLSENNQQKVYEAIFDNAVQQFIASNCISIEHSPVLRSAVQCVIYWSALFWAELCEGTHQINQKKTLQ